MEVVTDDFGSVDFQTVAEVEDVLDSWAEEARLAGLVQVEAVGDLRQGYCTLDDALEERLVAEREDAAADNVIETSRWRCQQNGINRRRFL